MKNGEIIKKENFNNLIKEKKYNFEIDEKENKKEQNKEQDQEEENETKKNYQSILQIENEEEQDFETIFENDLKKEEELALELELDKTEKNDEKIIDYEFEKNINRAESIFKYLTIYKITLPIIYIFLDFLKFYLKRFQQFKLANWTQLNRIEKDISISLKNFYYFIPQYFILGILELIFDIFSGIININHSTGTSKLIHLKLLKKTLKTKFRSF